MLSEEEKRLQKNYRVLLKRNHFCRDCLKQDAYTLAGRVYCAECTEKRKMHRHAAMTNERRTDDSQKHKALRDMRRKEHKCPRCGKQLENGYKYIYCERCRNLDRQAQKRKRSKLDINFPRGENGICWQCNKNEAVVGKRLCESCYSKMMGIRKHIVHPVSIKRTILKEVHNASYAGIEANAQSGQMARTGDC